MRMHEQDRKALRAIKGIVIVARKMAYDGIDHGRIAALLDHCEYLPEILLNEQESFQAFDRYLEEIVKDFPMCQWVIDEYRGGQRVTS